MSMTHYMELIAVNQPWNLILFMAIPVILAETVAITELYVLFHRSLTGKMRRLGQIAGILAGLYFAGIIAYLIPNAVLPITESGSWRGAFDMIAVGTYLLGGIPLILIALQELGLIGRRLSDEGRMARHAIYVGLFLVLAHVAMITGMLDPTLLTGHQMTDMPGMSGHAMSGMEHTP